MPSLSGLGRSAKSSRHIRAGLMNAVAARLSPPARTKLLCAINHLPTHYRRHNLPRKLPPIKRRVVRQRARLRGCESPALLGIEDGHVGKIALAKRSAPAQVEDARRAGGKKVDDASQWNLALAMKLCHSQRQSCFQSCNSESRPLKFDLLLMRGVGS